jgi:DNA repair photolyase
VTAELVGIHTGPRLLPVLSEEAKANLDPYMALIVGYRKSGLSLNHIIGCPLDCGYCVRHFWGNFDVKIPHLLRSTDEAINQLVSHHAFQPHVTPIQLFNKATDPFLPGVKPHLFQVLRALDGRGYTNHVLVITRFKVTETDLAELEKLRHLRVTLLFTYSGITDPRVEPIAKSDVTITSVRTAVACKRRTGGVLYWRPIVPGWNDSPQTMAGVLEVGRDADAIVFTGYYHKAENAGYLRELGVDVPYADDYARRKVMPHELDARVVAAWRESGVSTPLFRKTSCGVAFAHAAPDYNGHWGRPRAVRHLPESPAAALRRRLPGTDVGRHGLSPRPTRLRHPLRDREGARLDPRPRRTAPLRRPAHPATPDLGTRPTPLPARPRPLPTRARARRWTGRRARWRSRAVREHHPIRRRLNATRPRGARSHPCAPGSP